MTITKEEFESLSQDRVRLNWVMPVLSCTDDDSALTDQRAMHIAAALMLGKTGRDAIDTAMEGKP